MVEAGKHYWIRHKKEGIWNTAYVGLDCDDNKWIHMTGVHPLEISKMDLKKYLCSTLKKAFL